MSEMLVVEIPSDTRRRHNCSIGWCQDKRQRSLSRLSQRVAIVQ
jgi:hypothetical protein